MESYRVLVPVVIGGQRYEPGATVRLPPEANVPKLLALGWIERAEEEVIADG